MHFDEQRGASRHRKELKGLNDTLLELRQSNRNTTQPKLEQPLEARTSKRIITVGRRVHLFYISHFMAGCVLVVRSMWQRQKRLLAGLESSLSSQILGSEVAHA